MGEPTPQETMDRLEKRSSNQPAVKVVSLTGHIGAGYYLLKGLRATYAAGKLAKRGGPLAAAFVGAWIAREIHADEGVLKVAEFFGAERQASPGPEPAHFGHTIAHNHEVGGFLAGLVVGLVAGALSAATGGLALPLLIGAAGGFAAEAVGGAGAKMADVTGTIAAGSRNVRFESHPVARVGDAALCLKDSGPDPIIEGSRTILVNGLPLARIGHKTACGAVIQQGCSTIRADNTTVAYGEADGDLVAQAAMSFSEVMFARWFSQESEPSVRSTKHKYPDFNPQGGQENCGACSDAVDNYKAGRGFSPAPIGPRAWPKNVIKWDFNATPATIEADLTAAGNGARGIAYVEDGAGNAHVFYVENDNGKIVAIDGQSSVEGPITDVADHGGYSGPGVKWGWGPTTP